MNRDEQFEQSLRRQRVKQIPTEWRAQILAEASAASHASRKPRPDSPSWFHAIWQRLVWPHPRAWAGLATVWLVVLGLNFAARDSGTGAVTRAEAAPDSEIRRLLKQQEILFAELIDLPVPSVAERRKPGTPAPQTRRREEFFTV